MGTKAGEHKAGEYIRGALQPNHKAAARMKVEGRRIDEIAVELKVQKRTLYLWFSDDKMKAYIAEMVRNIEDVFAERMATSGLRALEEMVSFASENAARVQATCQTCGWFGSTPSSHGDPSAPCTGPWTQSTYIGEAAKLEALNSIMDRVSPTARLRDRAEARTKLPDGGTNYTAVFATMGDEQLAGFLKQWQAGSNGAIEGHATDA